MRKPSAETELRRYKALYRDAEEKFGQMAKSSAAYRERATKAEQEVKDWKLRFDALLKILPPNAGGSND